MHPQISHIKSLDPLNVALGGKMCDEVKDLERRHLPQILPAGPKCNHMYPCKRTCERHTNRGGDTTEEEAR